MSRMRGEGGFSLVEVLCAILLLGLGLAGLMEGITAALGSSKETERQTAAALLAAGQIEQLRAEGFLMEGETEGEGGAGMEAYAWRQTVRETSLEGLYEVTVIVTESADGREIFELKTMLFDPPVLRAPEPERRKNGRRES